MSAHPHRELVYVALGSNLGDRDAHLAAARCALAALPDTVLCDATEVEETAPLAGMRQRPYLNQMALLETGLEPHVLLEALHAIEHAEGRVRGERWGPRSLDLDIVRFGDRRIDDAVLTVPHPELPNRDFWRRELEALDAHGR